MICCIDAIDSALDCRFIRVAVQYYSSTSPVLGSVLGRAMIAIIVFQPGPCSPALLLVYAACAKPSHRCNVLKKPSCLMQGSKNLLMVLIIKSKAF